MANHVEIIASREQSTMASTWTEYLCLAPAPFKRYRLFTGRYEALAELSSYYNEETEEYELPDAIDGKSVEGFDDEYVVGGELDCFSDAESVEFERPDGPQVAGWLVGSGWNALAGLSDVSLALKKFPTISNAGE